MKIQILELPLEVNEEKTLDDEIVQIVKAEIFRSLSGQQFVRLVVVLK